MDSISKNCLLDLKYYSDFWKKDSLGKNGFRLLCTTNVLKKCNFINTQWSDLKKHLGEPNEIKNSNNSDLYIYYLTGFGDRYYPALGEIYFEIRVDKDQKVLKFLINETDG